VEKSRKRRPLTLIMLGVLLGSYLCGCTTVYFCQASDDFLRQAPEDRPFKILGPIHAMTWEWVFFYYVPAGPTYHEAEILLMQEAKKFGADAVIDIRYITESDCDESSLSHFGIPFVLATLMSTRSYHLSGLAIKYTDGGKD